MLHPAVPEPDGGVMIAVVVTCTAKQATWKNGCRYLIGLP